MEKKKVKLFSAIALVALAMLVVGATYAYFQNQYGASSNANVKVTTYTTDMLTFETGDAINISADQETFAQGKSNRTGSTFARATLQANNKTNEATANYYIYLNIESNEFVYTSEDQKAELVLQVTDKSGNPVTNIDGLTYVTVLDGNGNTIKGFDITEKSGLISLVNNKEIVASPRTEEQYDITLILVNYDFDQNNNAGKSFNAKLMIQKDKVKETIAMVCSSEQGLSDCIKAMNGKDDTLYHHDSNLTNGAGDNSYRYAGASDQVNNYVCFGSNVTPCPADNLYRIIGVFGDKVKLIKSDYATSALLGADGDYSKMYTANDWNNSNYKGNNLANIAGYTWNYKNNTTINSGHGLNTWSTSLLNKTNLNKNFITNIGAYWAAKIADTTWKVGGNTYDNIARQPVKTAYQNEIVSPVTTNTTDNATTYSAKVGLMYVSDYMYAAPQDKWTLVGYNGDASKDYDAATSVNWMYMGLVEWTISRNADNASFVFIVYDTGHVSNNYASTALALRPVFYLSSSVKFSSGDGTSSNPIRLEL